MSFSSYHVRKMLFIYMGGYKQYVFFYNNSQNKVPGYCVRMMNITITDLSTL